jgi:hypothetical protein
MSSAAQSSLLVTPGTSSETSTFLTAIILRRIFYCYLVYPLEVEKLQPQPLAKALDSIVVLNGITAVTGRNLIIEDTGA